MLDGSTQPRFGFKKNEYIIDVIRAAIWAKETHADGSTMVKNVYYKPDLTAAKKVAKQLGQVLSIKTKN